MNVFIYSIPQSIYINDIQSLIMWHKHQLIHSLDPLFSSVLGLIYINNFPNWKAKFYLNFSYLRFHSLFTKHGWIGMALLQLHNLGGPIKSFLCSKNNNKGDGPIKTYVPNNFITRWAIWRKKNLIFDFKINRLIMMLY